MEDDVVIKITGLRKSYKVLKHGDLDIKRGMFQINTTKDYTVIDGIDLTIKKGEVVGVLGRNGCGKSTFLKLVSKILKPTEGTVEVFGKVASILEMSMGFHNDLSGKENIILRSELYGINRNDAFARMDDIVKYADLGDFINNPVRTYSSGMRARLAFSIMVNVDADIFLVDEALSTGDIAFSTKASEHLKNLVRQGKTILFTSHSMGVVESTCNRAIWIEKGKLAADGPAAEVCAQYNRAITESLEITKELAEGGASSAQYRLATYYRDGNGVEKNNEEYLKWLKSAANLQHVIAMSEYADVLMDEGSDESVKEASRLYSAAADNGNYDARRKYASLSSGFNSEMAEIMETFRILAENGDHFDQYRYGEFLYKVALRKSDYKTAFSVLSAAEANGNIDAKFLVANMYRDGIGIERSLDAAVEKYEELAIIGHPKAMTTLADLYLAGKYVKMDTELAFKWYYMSACIGNAKSQYQVGVMYRDGIGVEKNETMANEWFRSYAESLISKNMLDAADSLKFINAEFPLTKFDLYRYAAESYNVKALSGIASMYGRGSGVETNEKLMFEYTKKSAKLVGKTKTSLGDLYAEGRCVEKDLKKADMLYRIAADSGDANAMYKFAMLHKEGGELERDDALYRKYIRMAAKAGNKEAKIITAKWDKRNTSRKKKETEENSKSKT